MLAKYIITSVSLPPRKICSYLPPVMDVLGQKCWVYTASHVDVARFNIGHIKFRCQGITQKKYNKQMLVQFCFLPSLQNKPHYFSSFTCFCQVATVMLFIPQNQAIWTLCLYRCSIVGPKFRTDWATNLSTQSHTQLVSCAVCAHLILEKF